MKSFIRAIPVSFPLARFSPAAVLMGAVILAFPVSFAYADGLKSGPAPLAQASPVKPPTAATMTSVKPETVEARITELHAKLQITSAEDSKWNDVANIMRDNAAAMEKLIAEKKAQSPKGMTALDDLTTYRSFAQAHLDGLKSLSVAFKVLYDAMPAEQKLVADQTFMNFRRGAPATHG